MKTGLSRPNICVALILRISFLQTNVMYYKGISHALATIARDEGLRGLYKGMGATLMVSHSPCDLLLIISTRFVIFELCWSLLFCEALFFRFIFRIQKRGRREQCNCERGQMHRGLKRRARPGVRSEVVSEIAVTRLIHKLSRGTSREDTGCLSVGVCLRNF